MKTVKTIAILGLLTAGVSQAAVTIAVKDFTSASVGVPVLTSGGLPLSGGSISVGFFSTLPNFANATPAQIIAAYTLAGTSTTFYSGASSAGLFNTSVTTTITYPDSTYTGNNIYVIVGNATTLASSTQLAVLLGDTTAGGSTVSTFPVVPSNGVASANALTTTVGNVVYGTIVNSGNFTEPSGTIINPGTYAQGVELLGVPEPSAALLGGLGLLGLLRRRR